MCLYGPHVVCSRDLPNSPFSFATSCECLCVVGCEGKQAHIPGFMG